MVPLDRILLFVMLTVILTSLFVPALDSAITENGENENLQESKTEYEARTRQGVSDAQLSFSESSKPPIVQWNGTYGGTGYEYAYALVQATDGGYALAGYGPGSGGSDVYVVKTDAAGDLQWEKTYGGQFSDGAFSIVETSDGGYAVAGYSNSYSDYPHNSDSYLVKIDRLGNLQWNRTYGGLDTHEAAWSMIQTSDGGFALAGYSYPGVGDKDIYFVKTDSNGEMQWNRTYPGVDDNNVNSLIQTDDGGYALTGYSWDSSIDRPALFLIKINPIGDIQWSWWYEATGRCDAKALVQTDDGGYALAGHNFTISYERHAFLVKTDGVGNIQWSKNYGEAASAIRAYSALSLVKTTDGGYALAGYTGFTREGVSQSDLYLVKTDSDGDMQWNITYGGTGDDYAQALIQTADGGYATAGRTRSFGAGGDDFWLVKFSAPDDLYVASVEPIQVVLDAKALVANKSTAVRATISSTFESRVFVEINVTYDFGRKWYLEDGPNDLGIPLDPGLNRVYIPGGPVKPTAYPDPWIPSGQPPWLSWSSIGFDPQIRATVDPLNKILESDETNNERTCGMKVVGSRRLKILVVPLYFPGQDRFDSIPSLEEHMNFTRNTYPVADKEFSWIVSEPLMWKESPPPTLRRIWLSTQVAPTMAAAAAFYDFDRVVCVMSEQGFPGEEIDYFWEWDGYSTKMWGFGIAFVFKEMMAGALPYPGPAFGHWNLVAHELGHTYFLQHPDFAGPEVYECERFSVMERDYERDAYTFMEVREAYLNPPSWIDKQRYDSDPKQGHLLWKRWNLLDQLTFNPHLADAEDVLLIRGSVFKNETAKADAWYRIGDRVPDLTSSDSGDYSVVLLNSTYGEICRMGFNASFSYLAYVNETWVENEIDESPFVYKIPFMAGTAFVEIRNSTDHLLLSRAISSNAPTINVTFPNGGETLIAGVNYTIAWGSGDLDGDPLAYSVAYSSNGGETWMPLALDIAENSWIWDTSSLQAGSSYVVRVIGTDWVNAGEDVSDGTFTILDLTPPSINVISPQNKTYFSELSPLIFETNEPASWIGYSIDNQANVTLNSNTIIDAEDGIHQIALYANDTSGNMGSSEIVHFSFNSSLYDPWKSGLVALGEYPIVDLAVCNGSLYAAVDNTLYAYDGEIWNIIYLPTYVTSIESFNDGLLVGGQGGLYYYREGSFRLIFQVSTYVKTFGVYNNTLYAGTFLDKPPKLYYCNGAVENPSNWHVDTDFSAILNFSGPFGSIDSFEEYNGNMYVTSGGEIYCFNGTSWSIAKTYDDVYAYLDMKAQSGKLYLATRDQGWRKPMYLGGSGFSGRVIEFDGENWTTILDHDYWMYSLETYENRLYAGTANKILIYNGTDWSTSFNALEGAYYAISFTVFDGKIYVGMGNGYIFADPVDETAVPSKSLPSTTIPELPPTSFTAFFIILSLPLIFLFKRRSCKRFGITSSARYPTSACRRLAAPEYVPGFGMESCSIGVRA